MSSESGHTPTSRRLNLKDVQEAPSASDESVGMELRAIRLQRGETVAQVSQVLRIRKDLVEAIEQSRHDLLPGQAYAVGFVRSYADYLRLDTADVVRRYKAEMAAQEPTGHFAIAVPEEEQRFSFVSVGVIVLCLAGAVAGAYYLATQAGWIGGSRPLTPGAAATAEADPAGSTTPPPEVLEGAQAAPAVAAPPPTPAPTPVPTPEPTPAARPGGIVPAAAGEAPQAATGREMGKSNTDARIVFIARRATLLTVASTELRNTIYINRTLEAGDSYRVPNKSGLALSISDAGALDVILDGTFIGRAGADGAAVTDFALSPEAYGAPAERPAAAPAPAAEPAAAEPAPAPAATPASPPAPSPED